MGDAGEDTTRRKDAHLDLCAEGDVEPDGNNTLLSQVHLVHCAMPELALDDVDLSTSFLGKRLRAPLLVTGMTGGTDRARQVNLDLAAVAEKHGLAFGVGSQRAMGQDASRADTFKVREVAPTAVVLGNVGLQQASAMGVDAVVRLVDEIGADGLAVHLNPAQELAQPEGDRDFRGGYAVLRQLAKHFGERLLVKETGCGLSPAVARRLVECGVKAVDVSGLGGTSWVRVEELRAHGLAAQVAEGFAGWGIPTAAAVASVRRAVGEGVTIVASGGLRTGLDVAKCLGLGADLGGMALPLFRAQQRGGREAASEAVEVVVQALRRAVLLAGAGTPRELRQKTVVVTGELKDWLQAL
ncbi:MAG TPA: type 2 isopentenyl-diphosphate Delta-isomerase [Myxococcaceae bacterium]|jgi:isopentenyl-diphosphate delta-isomerase